MNSTDSWLVHEHSPYEDLLSQCLVAVEVDEDIFRPMTSHILNTSCEVVSIYNSRS